MTEYVITEEQKKKIEEINHAFGILKKHYVQYVPGDYCCTYQASNKDSIEIIGKNIEEINHAFGLLKKYGLQYTPDNYHSFSYNENSILHVNILSMGTMVLDGTSNIDYTIDPSCATLWEIDDAPFVEIDYD